MLKKLLVSAALTMPLSSVMADQGEIRNIDQLRELCQKLESSEQVKFFDKGLICKGSHTLWKKSDERSDFPNQGLMFAKTSYDKCDTPLTTPGDQAEFESRSSAGECHVYDKYRISAPQVPIFVNSCEDLTVENIETLCRGAISDQCFDPSEASTEGASSPEGEQSESFAGACSMEKIGSLNTCEMYDRSCK